MGPRHSQNRRSNRDQLIRRLMNINTNNVQLLKNHGEIMNPHSKNM